MSLSNFAQAQLLRYYFQGLVPQQLPMIYIGLHNFAPGAGGDQTTGETFYTGYSRLAVAPSPNTFLVSQGSPTRAQNLSPLAFPVCSGALGDTLNFWSVGLAATGPGQLITYGPLGNGTVCGFTGSAGSPCTLFVPALTPGLLLPNSAVVLQALGPGCLLPSGFTDGQLYYVSAVNSLTGAVTLSLTPNGPPLSALNPGSGYLYPVTPMNVSQGQVPTFPPNSLLTFQG